MKYRHTGAWACSFLIAFVLCGCAMRPFEPNPKSGFRLSFGYTADKAGGSNAIADYIDDAVLYIFHQGTGAYVTSLPLSREQLLSSGGVPLELPDGDYRLVCWGNAHQHTSLPTGTHFDESLLSHQGFAGEGSVLTTADHLYYGITSLNLPRDSRDLCEIAFACAHIQLEVYLKGLSADAAPVVRLRHLTPQYDFLMRPVNAYSASYQPAVHYDAAAHQFVAQLQTLRFDTDNPVELEVFSSSGEMLHRLALTEFMATHNLPASTRHTSRAITTEDVQELTIPIVIVFEEVGEGKNVVVSVDIPSWGNEPVKPEV